MDHQAHRVTVCSTAPARLRVAGGPGACPHNQADQGAGQEPEDMSQVGPDYPAFLRPWPHRLAGLDCLPPGRNQAMEVSAPSLASRPRAFVFSSVDRPLRRFIRVIGGPGCRRPQLDIQAPGMSFEPRHGENRQAGTSI
jgi:hypothetical protein